MCLASHFDIIEIWKVNVGHRDIYYEKKILNFFVCMEVRILCKKEKYVWSHIFPKPLQQTCRLETIPLCLNTRLRVYKNFKIHINFIEINVSFCLLCAVRVLTSIILHTRRPVNKKSVTHLVFDSADFHFSHFEKLKITFFTSLHFAQRVMYWWD